MSRIILDLCGGTGSWSKPFADGGGYDVRVIDLKTGQDVRLFEKPKERIYGILAAPDCTHFAGSGARWWEQKGIGPLLEGLAVVDACLRIVVACQPKFWALENPIGRLTRYLGPPKMYFNPCDYGDPYTKKTALWGNFNPPKQTPVEPTEGSKLWRMYGGKSERTKTMRSITPPGFANAFFEANK